MTQFQWSNNTEILKKLDVSTAACSYCGGPARVPEDVAAVVEDSEGSRMAVVICDECTPGFIARLMSARDGDDADVD